MVSLHAGFGGGEKGKVQRVPSMSKTMPLSVIVSASFAALSLDGSGAKRWRLCFVIVLVLILVVRDVTRFELETMCLRILGVERSRFDFGMLFNAYETPVI